MATSSKKESRLRKLDEKEENSFFNILVSHSVLADSSHRKNRTTSSRSSRPCPRTRLRSYTTSANKTLNNASRQMRKFKKSLGKKKLSHVTPYKIRRNQ